MTELSDYDDIRELMQRYKRVPCQECENHIYATNDFRPDDWWCAECLPEHLDMSHLQDKVTVRL